MYLHIGNDIMINENDIIAVFDMDNVTTTENGRNFIMSAEKDKIVDDLSGLLPKSFIVVSDKFNSFKVYTSCLNTSTLYKRLKQRVY